MTTDMTPHQDTAAIDNPLGRRFQLIVISIAATALLLVLIGSDAGVGAIIDVALGYSFGISLVVVILLLAQFIWVRLRQRNQAEAPEDALSWYRTYFMGLRWRDILAAFGALVVTVSSFTVFKGTVVGSAGYGFDTMFIAWDRALFGGQDAWVLSHAVLPTPAMTKIIDLLYHPAFFPMVVGYTICIVARGRPALRYTYMVSYLASFVIVGMIMANALHSAGPVYDGTLFGDGSTFDPLVTRLAEQNEAAGPFSAVFAQGYLLRLHQEGVAGFGGGISAMPSMHIVLVFLWVLPAWHLHRVLGVAMTIYAIIIWIGSVHLGWHYFVDGLVGVAALIPIWFAAGRMLGLYKKP